MKTSEDRTFSLGKLSTAPYFRGRNLLLEYTDGSPCLNPDGTETKLRMSSLISLKCDHDLAASHASISFLGSPDNCTFLFEARTLHACPATNQEQSMAPIPIFLIFVIITVGVYTVGSIFLKPFKRHSLPMSRSSSSMDGKTSVLPISESPSTSVSTTQNESENCNQNSQDQKEDSQYMFIIEKIRKIKDLVDPFIYNENMMEYTYENTSKGLGKIDSSTEIVESTNELDTIHEADSDGIDIDINNMNTNNNKQKFNHENFSLSYRNSKGITKGTHIEVSNIKLNNDEYDSTLEIGAEYSKLSPVKDSLTSENKSTVNSVWVSSSSGGSESKILCRSTSSSYTSSSKHNRHTSRDIEFEEH